MCDFSRHCECIEQLAGVAGPSVVGLGRPCSFPKAVANLAFNKGENLYHQGDHVAGAYSLVSGMVALERVDADGDFVILRILQPGAFFPYSNLLGDGAHVSSARALTAVKACFIPIEALMSAMRDNPQVGLALLRQGCEEVRQNEETIFRLCSAELPERVLAALESLAGEVGVETADGSLAMTMPISWRDLGAMVGSGPEVISRTLRRLADSGRLSFRGRRVTLYRSAVEPARAVRAYG